MNAPTPKDVKELREFFGLMNCYGKFVRQLYTLVQPLNSLRCSGCGHHSVLNHYHLITPLKSPGSTWPWPTNSRDATLQAKCLG